MERVKVISGGRVERKANLGEKKKKKKNRRHKGKKQKMNLGLFASLNSFWGIYFSSCLSDLNTKVL